MKPEGVAPADYANSIAKALAVFDAWPESGPITFTDGHLTWEVGPDDLELYRQMWDADASFDRKAVPVVAAEYEAFIASGRYPYNDAVARFIADRHGIPGEVYHAAPGWGTPGNLVKPLHHEIFLASRQRRVAEQVAKEQALLDDGWKPIIELQPVEGQHIYLSFAPGKKCRVEPLTVEPEEWLIFPPRNRVNGWRLGNFLDQHRAYEKAKEQGWQKYDSARPIMFKEAS